MNDDMPDSLSPDEADLARLADGSLDATRRDRLRAHVEASPELAARLAEQERAVAMMRALTAPAPDGLRARIGQPAGDRRRRAARRAGWTRRWLTLPMATALAVAAAAIIVVSGAATRSPTVAQTVRFTLAAATLPAPAVDPADPDRLALAVGAVAFPSWEPAGWSTAGAREDRLGDRRVATVFYRWHGRRVGYAIVSGPPLAAVAGRPVRRYGVRFTLARRAGTELVTWVESGHTCVIAGRGVAPGTLLALATVQR